MLSFIELKKTELTGLIGREHMDILPPDVDPVEWERYRQQYSQASRLELVTQYPLQIDFELNSSCNLACPMCPLSVETNIDKSQKTWFSFAAFNDIVKSGKKQGLSAVKLNYLNEPLLRKDLPEFIRCAKESGIMDVYFSSNGLLLTRKNIQKMIALGLNRIQISVDAITEQVYQNIRPGGSLKKVLSNIYLLQKVKKEMESLRPHVRVNFVRTEINEHELSSFVDFWRERVEMIGVQEMIMPPVAGTEIISLTTRNKRLDGFRCSFPFKQLVINNEGNILPCCTFYGEKMIIGNIRQLSIKAAWESAIMENLRSLHYKGRYADHPICRVCVESAFDSI